jgi:hypothetical protein
MFRGNLFYNNLLDWLFSYEYKGLDHACPPFGGGKGEELFDLTDFQLFNT